MVGFGAVSRGFVFSANPFVASVSAVQPQTGESRPRIDRRTAAADREGRMDRLYGRGGCRSRHRCEMVALGQLDECPQHDSKVGRALFPERFDSLNELKRASDGCSKRDQQAAFSNAPTT